MKLSQLETALLPYEKKLRANEKLRHFIGVKEVDRPTYERYIIGPIERFDSRKILPNILNSNEPIGEEFRRHFKERTGFDSVAHLHYSELEPDDRIGQSLEVAGWRVCLEYYPKTFPVTPAEGRLDVTDRAWMSRLIKKAALWYGAEMVRITEVDPAGFIQIEI